MRRALLGAIALAALGVGPADVRPQDDLFGYVNGAWLAAAEVPADGVGCGTFADIADRTDAQLRAIIEDVVAGRARTAATARQQVTALYRSATDEARIEARGATPLGDELARIDAVRSAAALAGEAGRLSSLGTGGPFDGGFAADPARSGQTIVRIAPGGTLLPDLRYYLDADGPFASLRGDYEVYLRTIFALTARDAPDEAARRVLGLEQKLARARWGSIAEPASRRFTLRELAAAMPGWDWAAWARPQGLDRVPALLLERPAFFETFAALVADTPLTVWRNWLVARFVTAAAPFLSEPFDMARYRFFGTALTGQVEPRPRWRRGVTLVSSYLGDAVGRVYVERHLPASTRVGARRLLDRIVDAFRVSLREAALTAPAKREALARLSSMTVSVGAPAAWHEYAGLELRPDDLFGNWLRALAFESADRERAAAGSLPHTWARPPQTVNAYYSAATNEVVVPAALLQPPVFDPAVEDAANYGALGALAGHEIAHALGAGEDAADSIGLSVAWRAYKLALAGSPPPVIGDATADQRFFLAWARLWRSKERPEYLRSIAHGSYRLPRDRANAAASSVEGFYDAFGVKPDDRMFRPADQRVRW